MKIHEYNEMMAYLTRPAPKKVAGLMEEYYGSDRLKYQEAVKNGFQGTFEEYLQWMRKNAAQGGVIGKGGMFQGEDLGYRTGFRKIEKSSLPKNIRLTPGGLYRFTTEAGDGFSHTFPEGTKLSDAVKYRDKHLKEFGIEEGQLRKKTTGKFESVPGEKHIKFNGVTYQVNIQRGDEGAFYTSDLNKAIKKRDQLVKKYPAKTMTEYNIKEKPKQVNADILELYKDPTIKNMFKNGVLDEKGIAQAAKILGVSKGTAIDRLEQLSTALMGTRKDVPGIKPAFIENARKIAVALPGAKTKAAELATGVPLEGESISVPKKEIGRDAKYPTDLLDIDEARATASGLKRGTSPWSIFGQIIDRDVNRITKGGFEGAGWDSRAGTLEGELDDAVKNFGPDSKEAKAAMNKYNSAATKFENEVNSKKLRGAKRFRIPRISLDAPSKTIANWANFNKKYKDVFNENFKTKRYGFVIPKDLKTIPELRDEVLNPKSSTYKTMINHLKKGFNEYDEKKLFQKIRRMVDEAPDAVKKIMRYIPRIAQVDDISDKRYASASNIMTSGVQYVDDEDENFVERNPITTAVVAPFLSKVSGMTASKVLGVKSKLGRNIFDPLKQVRRGAKWLGKGALRTIGSPLSGTGFAASSIFEDIGPIKFAEEGEKNLLGLTYDEKFLTPKEDPNFTMAGLELLIPEVAKNLGSKVTTVSNVYNTLLRMGIPIKYAPQLIRGMTGLGLVSIGGDIAYGTKKWAEENLDWDPLTEEQRTDIQERKTAMPRMFDTYEQASKIAKEQGISYEDALKQLDTPNVPGITFNQGGRVGFAEGPKNPGRRAFIKGVTALAALPIVGRFFKLGKVLEKAGTYTGPAIEKIKGMPEWFPGLVKKLWNEGEDVTKTVAYKERQVVKRGTLEGGDDVDLVYDLDTGDVHISVTPKKGAHETTSGAYNKEYELDYKKGQADETTKGKKPPDDFSVSEIEGAADPYAMDVNWEGKVTTVDDAMTDLTELEAFARDKTTKQIHKKKGTKPKDVFPDYDPGDFGRDLD